MDAFTIKKKFTPALEDSEIGIFIGMTKEGGVIYKPHTYNPVDKLGLCHTALKIIESDLANQIGISQQAGRLFEEIIDKKLKSIKDEKDKS